MWLHLPAGTVTFLFTDIEGSTKLWETHPEAMKVALVRHDALLRDCIQKHRGIVVKSRGEGDSFFAVFDLAADAVWAALAIQQALQSEKWPAEVPLRVRVALHTGEAEMREGDYFGAPVNRCARLRAIAHGGQTLLSQSTAELVYEALPAGATLRDLGEHRLRDLSRPERVFQLEHPDLPSGFPSLKSLDALPNNLPIQLSSFIGREREKDDVKRLLSKTRLLTLTGVGGCGKTRLALQVAADLLEDYPDGVWVVELAALADATRVAQAVASTLAIREESSGQALGEGGSVALMSSERDLPLLTRLIAYLRSRKLLLILDNCEHILLACAQLADTLLRSCPSLRILATSREALGIAGELTYHVPSLSLPEPRQPQPVEHLSQFEAVRLFVDRSVFHQPEFRLTDENAPAVAQVCQRLDGIPLAIELAAARVKALPVEQIAKRLGDRFRLLTGGSRTALPRHQTLQAAMDWSYELLSEKERILFCRLSVFSGGFTLEAAETICVGEGLDRNEVMDLLMHLIDKSLVVYEERDGEARYRMLETVRQYSRNRLLESGHSERLRDRHLEFFVRWAEAQPHLHSEEPLAWLDQMEMEHDNLRAALEWSVESGRPKETEKGLQLAVALYPFWSVRGYVSEGREWLESILAVSSDASDQERAEALGRAGFLAWLQGDFAAAAELGEKSLALFRALGDKRGIAGSLWVTGIAVRDQQNENARAIALLEECLALHRELGDERGIGWAIFNLGVVAVSQRDYAKAKALLEESLTLFEKLDNTWGCVISLYWLGTVSRHLGDYDQFAKLLGESLALQKELLQRGLGNWRGLALCLAGLAGAAGAKGRLEQAARLYGAAESMREAIGASLPPVDRADYERNVALARAGLSEKAFAAAWAEGRAMTLEQAVEYALSPHNAYGYGCGYNQ